MLRTCRCLSYVLVTVALPSIALHIILLPESEGGARGATCRCGAVARPPMPAPLRVPPSHRRPQQARLSQHRLRLRPSAVTRRASEARPVRCLSRSTVPAWRPTRESLPANNLLSLKLSGFAI